MGEEKIVESYTKEEKQGIMQVIQKTFKEAIIREAQDIFLIEGERPAFRVKGIITKMSHLDKWDIRVFDVFTELVYGQSEKGLFDRVVHRNGGSQDFNLSLGESHLRCHIYSAFPKGVSVESEEGRTEKRKMQAVMNIRVVPKIMPRLSDLNLPDISKVFHKNGGLFLVSGRTNDGKSTTVASIINEFNRMTDRQRVILTIEDPVEFVHNNHNAWVIQRRVEDDTASYARATEDALREDADIVVIGELRKTEEMHNALRLAEVGKLVISTIHANGVADTVERFVSEFTGDMQGQIRTRLTENLLGILHQNLITKDEEQFPLTSMMLVTGEEERDKLRDSGSRVKLEKMLKEGDKRLFMTREDGFVILKIKGILRESDRGRYL